MVRYAGDDGQADLNTWLIDAGRYIDGDEAAIISAATAAIGKIRDLPEAQAAFDD